MTARRNCLAFASLLVILLATSETRAADAGVRIRFGLTDKEPQTWDGTVAVQPGKVALITGWRFEQGDHANGTDGWTASTRAAGDFRSNAQKAKAKANAAKANNGKKAGAAAKAKAKAGALASGLADNGVLITLEGVNESSKVQVKTGQGEFSFALSEIPYGN